MPFSRRNILLTSTIVIGLALTTACSKDSNDPSSNNPSAPSPSPSPSPSSGAPHISSLSPNTPIANGSAQTMTVSGDHFRNGMSVLFDAPNGVWTWYDGGAITLHSDTSFTVKAMIDKAGLWDITVHNADGAESNEMRFNVVAPNATN